MPPVIVHIVFGVLCAYLVIGGLYALYVSGKLKKWFAGISGWLANLMEEKRSE